MVKVSVLVVNVDHYLTKLSVDAELKDVKKLPWQELRPVIRVFGSCALGQKACIHIHGVRVQFNYL